jgi:transcriptional regulator with GAF, ATPase, and Fis domain
MRKVAHTDATVLITGETGTGKELAARAIHRLSLRRDHVWMKVNCAGLPSGLVESELFGHEKGAFTGAIAKMKGRFELAHGGTIFLDEIGELPLETQSKLLRVLQEQQFERVGGTQTHRVDVRVIAATNRYLEEDVELGAFRADLFFRVNTFPISMPPLRDLKDDIPLLTQYYVERFSKQLGKRIEEINPAVLDRLVHYDWPGNVRELANILERAVILCEKGVLLAHHLSFPQLPGKNLMEERLPTLHEAERLHILKALEKTRGLVSGPHGAAALLGLNRSTLLSRMRKFGIVPSSSRSFHEKEP